MMLATLRVPAEIVFGNRSAETVGQYVRRLGAKRALLISDRGLERVGLVDQIRHWLSKEGISSVAYVDVEPEPSVTSIPPCIGFARNAECDIVVGLGGGSALDTAKVVAMLLNNNGVAEDYFGTGLVKRPSLPSILLPTTAGTGSEVTPNALFYVPDRRAKEAIVSPFLLPSVAIVDPFLTHSVPVSITAATGMDALCHAIESYTSTNATLFSEPFAVEAIRLIASNLRQAVLDGQHSAAREGMALGSLYAAISMANSSTNGVHALAYPLQGLNRITHGVANSLLLPYVLDFNWQGNISKFAKVTELMGQPIRHLSVRNAAAESARTCQLLSEDVGIAKHMRDVGIVAEQIDDLIAGALKVTRLLQNNPRPIQAADIKTIYERAL